MTEEETKINDFDADSADQNIAGSETPLVDKFSPEVILGKRFDASLDYEGPDYLFEFKGIPCFALGGILVIAAAEKNGKSLYATILSGAALKGEYLGYKCLKEDVKILYFDTEQDDGDIAFLQRRVHHIAEFDYHINHYDKFVIYPLISDSVENRWKFIKDTIDYEQPTIVIIDGIADLVKNLNDYDTCYDLVTEQLMMVHDKHILLLDLIHTNHGSDKMQGWIGTILAKKQADCIRMSKFKNEETSATFTAEQVSTRHRDICNLKFKMDGSKLGVPVELSAEEEKQQDELDRVVKVITWKDGHQKEQSHEVTLKELIELDKLYKDKMGDGKYSLQDVKKFYGGGVAKAYSYAMLAEGMQIIEKNQYGKYVYLGKCKEIEDFNKSKVEDSNEQSFPF